MTEEQATSYVKKVLKIMLNSNIQVFLLFNYLECYPKHSNIINRNSILVLTVYGDMFIN